MRSFLSLFLISSGWLLSLSTGASAAAQLPIIYPAQTTNLDIGLLAYWHVEVAGPAPIASLLGLAMETMKAPLIQPRPRLINKQT